MVGPAFLGCGFWPFLLGVRAGPPFSGPSVFLMLVVAPSFLGLGLAFPCSSGVGPAFLGFGLALSLWCAACPFLLEVRAGPPFSGPSVFLMLVVGPSFLGLGLVFPCSSGVGPSFLGCGGWPFLLRVGVCLSLLEWGWPFLLWVWVGLSFSGWELVLSLFGVWVLPSFLGLPFCPPWWRLEIPS